MDWGKDDHAVAVVAADGEQTLRFSIAMTRGLRILVRRLLAAEVVEVGIERPGGPVVDALRQAGLGRVRHPTRRLIHRPRRRTIQQSP